MLPTLRRLWIMPELQHYTVKLHSVLEPWAKWEGTMVKISKSQTDTFSIPLNLLRSWNKWYIDLDIYMLMTNLCIFKFDLDDRCRKKTLTLIGDLYTFDIENGHDGGLLMCQAKYSLPESVLRCPATNWAPQRKRLWWPPSEKYPHHNYFPIQQTTHYRSDIRTTCGFPVLDVDQ